MITRQEFADVCQQSIALIEAAGMRLTDADRQHITAADFGLSQLRTEGIQIVTLFATKRIAAKILVLLPFQTEPEQASASRR